MLNVSQLIGKVINDIGRFGYDGHYSPSSEKPDRHKLAQDTFAVTPMTWMEVMVGVANKNAQADSLNLLNGFEMHYLTPLDMDWAMQQMLGFHFSKGVGVMDCFIVSVCRRLNLPIYTHNLKDYLKILPANLVVQPY